MGQICCVKETASTTETQVSYLGHAEGTVVPVPRLKNVDILKQTPNVPPDVVPEANTPQNNTEIDRFLTGDDMVQDAAHHTQGTQNGNSDMHAPDKEKDVFVEKAVTSSSLVEASPLVARMDEFEFVAGTWYFLANGKEAGMIKSDGALTFHNGMTGQLSKVVGRSDVFTLSSQPDAIIEVIIGFDGQQQMHWTDGNFSAFWSRRQPLAFDEYAGIWMRRHDGKSMVRIQGSGLVEWIHEGGPVNTKAKRPSMFTKNTSTRTSTATPSTSGTPSEIEPGAVFQLEVPQPTPRGEIALTMKSVSTEKVLKLVATNEKELRFESPPLQGMILIRKMSTDISGGV